jgi:transcriptional regulator with XRE-family HTH domain
MIDQGKDLIFHTSLGEVVKAWRAARELTVTELAARAGRPITKGYISEVEHNKIRQPNDEYLVRIAAALDIPVLFLVTRRLPHELSPDEQVDIKAEGGGFSFGSPLPLPRRRHLGEEEELRQILAQLDELRSRVKKLIAQKGRQH